MSKHRVFISYHHRNDQRYKNRLVEVLNHNSFIDCSVDTGDIDDSYLTNEGIRIKIRDEYLRNTTVTIVLLGAETHKRKHVDWEISSSLIKSKLSSRSGLVGILLPNHPTCSRGEKMTKDNTQERFFDNYKSGFAELIRWDEVNSSSLSSIIEKAYNKRDGDNFDNSAPLRRYNS